MLPSKLSYLNFILTVIAIGLTVIILQNANVIPAAKANISSYPVLPINEMGEMVVRVANSEMDVVLTEVSSGCCYGTIPVQVENTVTVEVDD